MTDQDGSTKKTVEGVNVSKNSSGKDICVVEFSKESFGGGVVFPADLGFVPEKGMGAIWDAASYMGASGQLSFFNTDGKMVFSADREEGASGNWNVKFNPQQEEKIANASPLSENDLMPIFQTRMEGLAKANPDFYEKNKDFILKSSLAAQDLYKSGLNPDAVNLGGMHKKYGLDQGGDIHPLLAADLYHSLVHDINEGVADKEGNIVGHPYKSAVLKTPHGSSKNGLAIDGIDNDNHLAKVRKKLAVKMGLEDIKIPGCIKNAEAAISKTIRKKLVQR